MKVPLIISSWLGSSNATPRVPQFLLDAGHPWLTTHARELCSLPDATSFICMLSSDDAHSQYGGKISVDDESAKLRERLEVPADLFHRLEIRNVRAGMSRYGWKNARDRLNEMKACPRALAEVRELTVDVYVHTGMGWQTLGDTWDTLTAESRLPPKSLPALFSEVTGKMKNLSKIEWMVRGVEENAAIGKAFIEDGTRLPGVKHLVTTMNAPWLVDACPSLNSLEAKHDDFVWGEAAHTRDVAWFAAAGKLKGLRKLDMGEVEWTGTMTDCVLRDTPHIEELHIGAPAQDFKHRDINRGNFLRDLIKSLSLLPSLTQLHLPPSYELQLGYDGGSMCGNAYMGANGAVYWRSNMAQGLEATELAGKIVRQEFPGLHGVYVGASYGNFATDDEGEQVIIWDWTGRVDEWLDEKQMAIDFTDEP
ncbi:hypothetical protein JMJ77_0011875 [Colletotrichum scovillei]|uniref:Uncharacterized protein n=1 Tax=Colletotrichum scovillei TaxID=1209932 RepID=A0A9P7QVS2_9PEZI|nr:hypothetical protein JMJ77_0011875 [Colletotrichum scovillei]KAG7046160.1 hypothetical protein JMJ78_0011227 [Colletotrichum scovillei]KAG7063506.1 hypothetical protein JMJ76_0005970 [Colletotrichum scovillei]